MEEILKEILSQMQVMSNKLQSVSDKQDETNSRLVKLETKIENCIEVKIQALFEDRDVVHGKLDIITDELVDIKEKVMENDLKMQVVNSKAKAI